MLNTSEGARQLRARFEAADDTQEKLTAHVLLAEDNTINQRLMKIKLQEFGLTVDVVADGEQAIEAFRSQAYDLVLMDISMPRLGGVEAAEAIKIIGREKGRSVPVVALTAHSLKGDRDRLLSQGMDDYLPKPVDFGRLYDLLSKYLSSRSEPISSFTTLQHSARLSAAEAHNLLQRFSEHAAGSIGTLRRAMANNDVESILRISHNLKGTAGNLRLDRISRLAAELVEGELSEHHIRPKLDLLDAEVRRLGDSLVPEGSSVAGEI